MAAHEGSILLVEDTPTLSFMYRTALETAGFEVQAAFLAEDARRAHGVGTGSRIVLLDLMLPDGDGLDLLQEMRRSDPDGCVIVITANGSINKAVDAMRGGAFDFLVKPFDNQRLLSAVRNAASAISAAPRSRDARPNDGFHGFIGSSREMSAVYDLIADIGRSTATVFITGESGAGKEIAAQAIHAESGRAGEPFIALNCGAIPADLLESEVFGHLRGSFTGAIADKTGAAAAADGGTLFLDEICEMDLALQTKLLRFLQTSTVTPVGATTPRKVDARIVCATNRDPVAEVKAGRFREDLFYRLHVVPVHLPALRERGDDVIEIAETLLRRHAQLEGKRFMRLSDEARDVFRTLPWPGNVRQLQNVVWNVVLLHDGEIAEVDMLPRDLLDAGRVDAPTGGAPPQVVAANAPLGGLAALVRPLIGQELGAVEREFIEATILSEGGSVPKAAKILGLSPSTIYRKREAWAKSDAVRAS